MRTVRLALLAAFVLVGAVPSASAMEAGDALRLPKAWASLSGAAKRQSVGTVKLALKAGYRPLSELTGGAYPAFSPGIGAVYAKRETMPMGPFIAYDHKGRQVSTIYKFSLDKMAEKAGFEAAGIRMPTVDHVSGYFSGSHPGVDFPHYSFVYWHVPKKYEAKLAK